MLNKILKLAEKSKSIIMYLIFGVLTTAVNVVAYYICAHIFSANTVTSSVIAWFAAVLFAYVTNRKWVFDSKETGFKNILFEVFRFFLCRFATGVVDWVIMYVFVDLLSFNDIIIKILANVIVIILNYVASLLVIFRKKDSNVKTV